MHLRFRGVLNDKLRGFYRSTFKDGDGAEQVIATTQMEPVDARRAFPCWDEPDKKAVFAVTLVVAEDLLALSNGAQVSEEATGDGRRAVRFADTIPMSTYLVAFVVGPLEATAPVDVDGVPLRVVHAPGKDHLSSYALEVGAFCLRWFADYYGIAYPGGKLDLVAIPDFAAGAMENLGAITFREAVLLVDPDAVTQLELQRVADVVAHEIAHMWFGDLVTMKWWNGLWLNEAFATFMELAAVDAFKPEWHRWVAFTNERAAAFAVDSLGSTRPIEYPVRSPGDAEGMFDVLTYQKGASVLRMLEQYLGTEGFRAGIRRYLSARQFANAETTDLWDAIEEATGEPVRRIMDSWIFQGGYPIVAASRGDEGRLALEQQRFSFAGADEVAPATWSVPLLVSAGVGTDRVLLEEPARTTDLALDGGVAVVNAGGHGFYRVRYSPELLERLQAALPDLAPIERALLVDDTWAAVLAGETPASTFLELAAAFSEETDRTVWTTLAMALGQIDRIVEGEARERFRAFVRDLARPAFGRLGWTPQAGRGRAHPPAAGHPRHPARRGGRRRRGQGPGPRAARPAPGRCLRRRPQRGRRRGGRGGRLGDDGGLRRVPRAVPDRGLAPGVAPLPLRPGRLPRPGAGPADARPDAGRATSARRTRRSCSCSSSGTATTARWRGSTSRRSGGRSTTRSPTTPSPGCSAASPASTPRSWRPTPRRSWPSTRSRRGPGSCSSTSSASG